MKLAMLPDSDQAGYAAGQRLAVVGMVVSAFLAFIKLAGGMFSGSTALIADGLESGSDVLTSAIVFGGMTIARRPADEQYPYGYGRAESLAGKTVGTILLMSAVLLGTHSVHKILQPTPHLPAWALIPLAVSFVAKAALSFQKRRVGNRIRSSALLADATNDWVDMLSATVASIALALALWNPERFSYADPLGGVAVAIIIFCMGISIFKRTSRELMDVMPEPDLVNAVRNAARTEPGVEEVEKCFGRKSGILFFFDLHVQVNPELTVREAHNLAHRVKDRITTECSFVRDVLVHVEPHE